MNAATVSGPRSQRSGGWGLGIGDWGDWWLGSLITNYHSPQSPIPNSHSPAASVLLDRHEDLTVAAPDEQLGDAARLDLAELARGVAGVGDALQVEGRDNVTI